MKVLLFLYLYTIPFFLYAQTTWQGSFSPLQEMTKLEYRVQEGSASLRCKFSFSPSGITAEPYGSYEGYGWNITWKPKNFLGRSWLSTSLENRDLRLSYLYDDDQSKAFHIEGRCGGFAYLLDEKPTSLPAVYTWQGKGGKVFCFWNAESPHANLSLVCSWAGGERFSLSRDISLSEGALTLDWDFDGSTQEQSRSVALVMKNQNITAKWQTEFQIGNPPCFGGQKQTMERFVLSKISYTLGAYTLGSTMKHRVLTKKTGDPVERSTCQLKGKWKGYVLTVAWDSLNGMAVVLEAEQGTLRISARDGISFSLLLKRGPLSLTIKKDTKERLSITYSFRFTSYRDSESLLAR